MKSPHQMRLQDFAVLATHAFAKTWYDVAISFLQPVIASMPKMKMSPKEESQLKTMVKNLVRLNNGYITKTMVRVMQSSNSLFTQTLQHLSGHG